MRAGGSDGVGGFNEELPALLVVLVAVSLFVAGVASAYASYSEQSQSLHRREACQSFLTSVMSEPALLRDSRPGLFDWARISSSNGSALAGRFPAERMGFNYSLRLEAVGGDCAQLNASWGESPPRDLAVVVSLDAPCNVVDTEGRVHPAVLRLAAWGFAG